MNWYVDNPINTLYLHLTIKTNIMNNIGKVASHGCDMVEIKSIVVNGFVNVKFMNTNNNGKTEALHIDSIEII